MNDNLSSLKKNLSVYQFEILPPTLPDFKSHCDTPSTFAKLFFAVSHCFIIFRVWQFAIIASLRNLSQRSLLNWNHQKQIIRVQTWARPRYQRYQYKQFSLMHFLYSPILVHNHSFPPLPEAGRKNIPEIHLCSRRVSKCKCSNSRRYNYSWQPIKLLYRQI